MLCAVVALAGLAAAPEALADGLVPATPAVPAADVTSAATAALAETLPAPPATPTASQDAASSATATVSRTAQALPHPLKAATDEASRAIERLPVDAEPPPSPLSAEHRPAAGPAARLATTRLERRTMAAGRGSTLRETPSGPLSADLALRRLGSVDVVTESTEAAATARSTSGPENPLPGHHPTGFPTGIASAAAPALLLLLLVLMLEGFAGAPRRPWRMLSLRRLAPASFPFPLELERPD